MPLEDMEGPDKFLEAFVIEWPTGTDPKSQGDDHLRGLKNCLINTFGPIDKFVDLSEQGGPGLGSNSILRFNALHIVENIDVWDNPVVTVVESGTNRLLVGTENNFFNNDLVNLSTDGTMPDGIDPLITYYVVNALATTMQLALTFGGPPIDILDDGTGNHTLYRPVNASTVGPILIEDTFTVEVKDGSTWSIY